MPQYLNPLHRSRFMPDATSHPSLTNNPHSVTLEQARAISNILSGNIDFNTNSADNLKSINFDIAAGYSVSEGEITYNADEGTWDFGMPGGVVGQVFQEMFFYAKNETGSIVADGKPAMFSAPIGISGKVEFQLAIADGTIPSSYIMGITTQDIGVGEFGKITWFGNVRGIDTTGTPYGEVWSDGDLIYVGSSAGTLTNIKPNVPNQIIEIAAVTVAHTNGTLLVRPTWRSKLSDLDDVNGTPVNKTGQVPMWNQSEGYFDFNFNVSDAYQFGFVTTYDGTQETTIDFDGTTFTLAPTGSTWGYYRNGIKYTITGSKTVVPAYTSGTEFWYIYIDDTAGTLTASQTAWTLEDTKVPVATIVINDALTPTWAIADERHTCAIDRRFHWEHHFTDGTEVITLSEKVSGTYTVTPAVPSTTANTIGFSAGIAVDEDIKIINKAITDPNGVDLVYPIVYRTADTASASDWSWSFSEVPYSYGATYIKWDNAGTLTEGSGNKFYNSYVLMTNMDGDDDGLSELAFIHGQGEYSTLAAAQAEDFSELDLGGIIIHEFVSIYQLTWQTSAAYTGALGYCRLAAEPMRINVSASGGGSGVVLDHATLTDLPWDVAGHEPGITEKVTPISGDLIPIWDSASSNAPKYIQVGNLPSGSGDVVGPASATDNAIARFDTTTGKLLQNSTVTISDIGLISGLADGIADGDAVNQSQLKWVNIERFGAVGDVKLYRSEAVTATALSNTLITTTPMFAASDAEKDTVICISSVGIDHGGGNVGDLVTTIAGYTSPTQVTLTDAIVTTAATVNISFGTDDDAAFQAALTYARANGAVNIYIPKGNYYFSTQLLFDQSWVNFVGDGSDRMPHGTTWDGTEQFDHDHESTHLWFVGTPGITAIRFYDGVGTYQKAIHDSGLQNMSISGNGVPSLIDNAQTDYAAGIGIQITASRYNKFTDLYLERFSVSGLQLDYRTGSSLNWDSNNSLGNVFDRVWINQIYPDDGIGIKLSSVVGQAGTYGNAANYFRNIEVWNCDSDAIKLEESDNNHWYRTTGLRNPAGTGVGLRVTGSTGGVGSFARYETFDVFQHEGGVVVESTADGIDGDPHHIIIRDLSLDAGGGVPTISAGADCRWSQLGHLEGMEWMPEYPTNIKDQQQRFIGQRLLTDDNNVQYIWDGTRYKIDKVFAPLTLYLDSVTGSDTNTGLTSGSAIQTLAGLRGLLPNVVDYSITISSSTTETSDDILMPQKTYNSGSEITFTGSLTDVFRDSITVYPEDTTSLAIGNALNAFSPTAADSFNQAYGEGALSSLVYSVSNINNIAIGPFVFGSLVNSAGSVGVGPLAAAFLTTVDVTKPNTIIGNSAGLFVEEIYNYTLIGNNAGGGAGFGISPGGGEGGVVIGSGAYKSCEGDDVVAIGTGAAANSIGSGIIVIGSSTAGKSAASDTFYLGVGANDLITGNFATGAITLKTVNATVYNGPGTGLTGTASSLNIGGNAGGTFSVASTASTEFLPVSFNSGGALTNSTPYAVAYSNRTDFGYKASTKQLSVNGNIVNNVLEGGNALTYHKHGTGTGQDVTTTGTPTFTSATIGGILYDSTSNIIARFNRTGADQSFSAGGGNILYDNAIRNIASYFELSKSGNPASSVTFLAAGFYKITASVVLTDTTSAPQTAYLFATINGSVFPAHELGEIILAADATAGTKITFYYEASINDYLLISVYSPGTCTLDHSSTTSTILEIEKL